MLRFTAALIRGFAEIASTMASRAGFGCTTTAQGTLEGNDIFGNALAGVEIKTGANPTLRSNRIHDGKGSGVVVHDENGQGTLEDNEYLRQRHVGG